jgi:hypothetical protein
MKRIKRLILSLAALLIASGFALSAPVSARGSDDATSVTASSDPTETMEVHNLTAKLRHQGETEIEAHQHNLKAKSQVQRERACTARKKSLTNRMDNTVTWANKHKAVIDKIYTRVKDFHDSKNLNVPDYAALTAAVDTAQGNAQVSIDALDSLNVDVDCGSQTVAVTVSTFQQSVKDTRDSLKSYRAALVQLIKSLKGASTGAEDNSSTNSAGQ